VVYFCNFFGALFLKDSGITARITIGTESNRKGESMHKGREKKEIRARAESQTRSEKASVGVVPGESFVLSETESKLLGDLWDRQRSSSRSNYTFTDAPSCI
jgi:hypothetical protein